MDVVLAGLSRIVVVIYGCEALAPGGAGSHARQITRSFCEMSAITGVNMQDDKGIVNVDGGRKPKE